MQQFEYLMESEEEAIRLDLKTDSKTVEKQALWAGLKPGMRVADLGCGSGKTSFYLNKLAQPNGETIGVDMSEQRIKYAIEHYSAEGLKFHRQDIREPLDNLGMFDFIWVRFVLEYYRLESFDILKNIFSILKPGGILCLIDLDYNCLSHFGIPQRLEKAICEIMKTVETHADFDPYAGRKLYTYLYDLGCYDIDVSLAPHHLIYGELKPTDHFNWSKKVELAGIKSGYPFNEYKAGYEEFAKEFKAAFANPRRFTYTPVICSRGRKSLT